MIENKRIENLRIDADQTQTEIANVLHCQREVYRRYEKGTQGIPIRAAAKLTEYYDVSVDYLLGLSDERRKFM